MMIKSSKMLFCVMTMGVLWNGGYGAVAKADGPSIEELRQQLADAKAKLVIAQTQVRELTQDVHEARRTVVRLEHLWKLTGDPNVAYQLRRAVYRLEQVEEQLVIAQKKVDLIMRVIKHILAMIKAFGPSLSPFAGPSISPQAPFPSVIPKPYRD